MNRRQIIKIIDELKSLDAILFVIWDRDSKYPRIWLRDWCGFRTSVSIATAEMILNDILAGNLRPGRVKPRPVYRKITENKQMFVETVFIN